ncbi:MAG TPA: MoxR family ATPase [Gemmataceae bacterium]|jgi:MoxR-like ATPase|nr:MoxR family ATPase [Gemmataceae bacterium]
MTDPLTAARSTAVPHAADGNGALKPLADRVRLVKDQVLAEVRRVVVGMDAVAEQLLIALLANGHVLLEGVPGVAKTTLSKAFARILGGQYQRIQFTPDLLPSDVTGTSIFDRQSNQFVLRKGPIFCQVLLADEVNRAPAKTQSALLEAMQEYQVTIDGEPLPLPLPFLVLATQNPVEQEGVYRLPEAQLDRFLLRVTMGYPGHGPEVEMLRLHSRPPEEPAQVLTPDSILDLQRDLPHVYAAETLLHYIVALAEASRQHPDVALGASPRAALNLLRCARARALLAGRPYCTHEDVQAIALGVLGHRLIIRPEAEIEGKQVADVIGELLAQVPVLETK